MAAYPSYNILLDSTRQEESGVEDDYAESGQQHSRIFHSQSYFTFLLRHQLSITQWKALKTTYDAGKRSTYTLTYFNESPQQTYTVKFTGPPQIVANIDGGRFLVEVPLRGTAD